MKVHCLALCQTKSAIGTSKRLCLECVLTEDTTKAMFAVLCPAKNLLPGQWALCIRHRTTLSKLLTGSRCYRSVGCTNTFTIV